jgi:phosphatidylserine decarboxylase
MSPNCLPVHAINSTEDQISALDQAGGVIALLGALGLAGLAGWLLKRQRRWLILAAVSQSALTGLFWLFRNPTRRSPQDPNLVAAPCDGDVRGVTMVQEERFLKAPAYQVTIRVRPGDVQIMRAPIEGFVRYRCYQTGGSTEARDDVIWFGTRQPDNGRVLVQLTSSGFWRIMPRHHGRRITVLPDLEDSVQQGQITGHLPLGGEVQVYVPVTAQIAVGPGVHTRAGETVLARV